MRRIIPVVLALSFVLSAAKCSTPAVIDPSISAAEAGDVTAFMSGCGSQPQVGYLYCRKKVGDITGADFVQFHGPEGTCDKPDACTFIDIYYPNGSNATSVAIPKKETTARVLFSALTKKSRFDEGDRGYWGVIARTYWKDSDGAERVTVQDGEIRLRVYAANYTPLNETPDSPHFGWAWSEDGHDFRMTTSGRAYVGN